MIRNWLAMHSLVGTFYRLSLASPLKLYSKFVLANLIMLSAKSFQVLESQLISSKLCNRTVIIGINLI